MQVTRGGLRRRTTTQNVVGWALAVSTLALTFPAAAAAAQPAKSVLAGAVRTPGAGDARTRQVRLGHAGAAGMSSPVLILGPGAGYQPGGSAAVRSLQRRLIQLAYSPGPVDGRYGPLTEAAVAHFQAADALHVDGIAGPLTLGALASARLVLYPGAGLTSGGSSLVRTLQRELAAAGPSPGPIDGGYGPRTERAVMRFQAARRLAVDGIAGPQTLDLLQTFARADGRHRSSRGPSRPRTAPRHPRAPDAQSTRAPAGRNAASPQSDPPQGSPSSFSIVWIIALACALAAVMLAAELWRRRPRGVDHSFLKEGTRSGRRKVPYPGQAAVLRKDVADHMLPSVELRGGAAQLQVAEDDVRDEDSHTGDAAFRLGVLLAREGDLVGAEDAFRRADDHGHAWAAFELGVLLRGEGDRAAAAEALRRAEQRGHPDAAFGLGAILTEAGDYAGAEEAFRRADRAGDPGAACNLGVLLERRGDPDGAKDAYARGDARGHAIAACNLGAVLESEGDVVGAREAYRRADMRGDPMGSYHLGLLLERRGDRDGAKAAYSRADQRGNPAGACNLGLLLKQERDREGALRAFRRAGAHGSGEVAEVAHAAILELADSREER